MDSDLEHLRTIINTQQARIEELQSQMRIATEFLAKALEAIAKIDGGVLIVGDENGKPVVTKL